MQDEARLGDGIELTYLSTDSVGEGVGTSQVLSYVERLAARGVGVHLHTFEKDPPGAATLNAVEAAGIRWTAHPFGRFGPAGGIGRIARGAAAVRAAQLVHARSDLSAASVMLAMRARWVWDVRSLFADQRLALGTLKPGSLEHRALRRVEGAAAQRSTAAITLTKAVIPVIAERYGMHFSQKASVVTTCVDLRRFPISPLPDRGTIRLLLAGTLNRYYDVPAMVAIVAELGRRRPTVMEVMTPGPSPWDDLLEEIGHRIPAVGQRAMPECIAQTHVGLSVCRQDAGISLRGSMPTKIGEFLASGRPVVVNAGLGDASDLVRTHGAGVVLSGTSIDAVTTAADDLERLLADPETSARCRRLAEQHFDLDQAADRLVTIYRNVLGS